MDFPTLFLILGTVFGCITHIHSQVCPIDDDENNPTLLPHPNCTKFYKCYHGKPVEIDCPMGLQWDQVNNLCNWPELANCTENVAPSLTKQNPEKCPLDDDENNPTLLPHPNCTKFYKCYHGRPVEIDCPTGLQWDQVNNLCNWPELANCIENVAPPLTKQNPEKCPLDDDETSPTLLPHPDCTKFYKCFSGEAYEQECPIGLEWNKQKGICDSPLLAKCKNQHAPHQDYPIFRPNFKSCPLCEDISNPIHLAHPNCSKFYKCQQGGAIEFECPVNLRWNADANICDWPELANCDDQAAPYQPPAMKAYCGCQ